MTRRRVGGQRGGRARGGSAIRNTFLPDRARLCPRGLDPWARKRPHSRHFWPPYSGKGWGRRVTVALKRASRPSPSCAGRAGALARPHTPAGAPYAALWGPCPPRGSASATLSRSANPPFLHRWQERASVAANANPRAPRLWPRSNRREVSHPERISPRLEPRAGSQRHAEHSIRAHVVTLLTTLFTAAGMTVRMGPWRRLAAGQAHSERAHVRRSRSKAANATDRSAAAFALGLPSASRRQAHVPSGGDRLHVRFDCGRWYGGVVTNAEGPRPPLTSWTPASRSRPR